MVRLIPNINLFSFIFSIKVLGKFYRDAAKARKALEKVAPPRAQIDRGVSEIKTIMQDLPSIPTEFRKEISTKLSGIQRAAVKMKDSHQDELLFAVQKEQLYRNLASVGITTLAFAHEAAVPLGSMRITLDDWLSDIRDGGIDDCDKATLTLSPFEPLAH